MISIRSFGEMLRNLGFDFYSGVPCSFLKSLFNYAMNNCEYIAAVNEGDAVAAATGAYLGGRKSVVLMQNSGLANAVSPLTSLNYSFHIPLLGFVSLRGESGLSDEPQHELMGQITHELLQLMGIRYMYLSPDMEEAELQLLWANRLIEEKQTVFFIVRKGTFSEETLKEQRAISKTNIRKNKKMLDDEMPLRYEALRVINSLKDHKTVQLATTGLTGRELYEIEDAPNNLYMIGSMGCVSSFGMGLALAQKDKNIVVIDGDGALLMRMGNLAVNGYYSPRNMLHILLDNSLYDSTGGQFTVSPNIDFVEIAAGCGYENSIHVHSLTEIESFIRSWKENKGLTFLHLRIAQGSKAVVSRPAIKPHEVKERLRVFLDGEYSGNSGSRFGEKATGKS